MHPILKAILLSHVTMSALKAAKSGGDATYGQKLVTFLSLGDVPDVNQTPAEAAPTA